MHSQSPETPLCLSFPSHRNARGSCWAQSLRCKAVAGKGDPDFSFHPLTFISYCNLPNSLYKPGSKAGRAGHVEKAFLYYIKTC